METSSNKSYGLNVLLQMFGISRSTVRYYEKMGVINPQTDEQTQRKIYSDADVYSIIEHGILKSSGYSLREAQEIIADPQLEDKDVIQIALEKNRFLSQWHRAITHALERDIAIRSRPLFQPCLALPERWLLFLDNSEAGYDNFNPPASKEAQQALFNAIPITSFGNIEYAMFGDSRQPAKRGLVIPESCLPLVPDLLEHRANARTLGGAPAISLTRPVEMENARDPVYRQQLDLKTKTTLEAYGDRNGLSIYSPPFSIGGLPLHGTFLVETFAPVEAVNGKGRRLLAKLKRRGAADPMS